MPIPDNPYETDARTRPAKTAQEQIEMLHSLRREDRAELTAARSRIDDMTIRMSMVEQRQNDQFTMLTEVVGDVAVLKREVSGISHALTDMKKSQQINFNRLQKLAADEADRQGQTTDLLHKLIRIVMIGTAAVGTAAVGFVTMAGAMSKEGLDMIKLLKVLGVG